MTIKLYLTNEPDSEMLLPTNHPDEPTSELRGPGNEILRDALKDRLSTMDGHGAYLHDLSARDLVHTLCLLGYGPYIKYQIGGHLMKLPRPPIPPGADP